MVQGGDPLTKDAANAARYGTGGLNAVKAEARAPKMTRGSVAAVTIPGRPDSAGSQFFIVLADQPSLDNHTPCSRMADGMEALVKIPQTPIDANGAATERVEIKKVTIRDTLPEPFIKETAAELSAYRAILDTSAGPITVEFLTDKAPETVRQFMRLAEAGVYNQMAFHRVAPGFVIQTGATSSRQAPLTEKQQKLVHNLAPEFNDTKHVKGIVSMARGDAPDSAQTSFFICVGTSTALDGVYTAFGRVVDGMTAVDTIEAAPRTGEAAKYTHRAARGEDRQEGMTRRHLDRDADQIFDGDAVARLEILRHGSPGPAAPRAVCPSGSSTSVKKTSHEIWPWMLIGWMRRRRPSRVPFSMVVASPCCAPLQGASLRCFTTSRPVPGHDRTVTSRPLRGGVATLFKLWRLTPATGSVADQPPFSRAIVLRVRRSPAHRVSERLNGSS